MHALTERWLGFARQDLTGAQVMLREALVLAQAVSDFVINLCDPQSDSGH